MKIPKRKRTNTSKGLSTVKNDGSDKMILWFVIPTALAAVVFMFRKQLGLGIRTPDSQIQRGTYTDPNFRAQK